MKILFIVPYVPTLIRVRPYQMIRALAKQGHEVTLATLWTTEEERADLANIAPYCGQVLAYPLLRWRIIRNLAGVVCTRLPYQSAYCWQPELAESITSLLNRSSFDAVHVEHLRGARYGLAAKAALAGQHTFTPVIWDSVDCISHLFQQALQYSRSQMGRLMPRLDLARTRRYEGWLVKQFDRVLVTSAADKQALANLAQSNKKAENNSKADPSLESHLQVIANGVDFTHFAPRPHRQTENEANLVFTGKMSYHANVTAALYLAQEIMPHVWNQRPDAKLWLVGKDPPAEIRALASIGGAHKQVEVTGTVPDIRPFLHQATIAVAPLLYGAGIQNKLLEAMACGVPVVTTPLATVGLQAQASKSLVAADGTENFVTAILKLLQDCAGRNALAQRGRCYVEEHHDWSNVAVQLEGVYQTARAAQQGQRHA